MSESNLAKTVLRKTVLELLCEVAPDVDPEDIDPTEDLREEADIDSMDFLTLLIAIKRELGIEVPERDYKRLGTLDEIVAYLGERGTD